MAHPEISGDGRGKGMGAIRTPRWMGTVIARSGSAISAAGAARSAAGWLAILVSFFLSMELTTRIADWVRFGMPILSPVTSEEDLIVRDSAGMHGRASVRYRKWSMNSLGLRGREVAETAPPGTIRIIVVGASETFGLYESPGKQFPQQLEDSLNARLARGEYRTPPRSFQVLNAAMPGMSLPTLEQDFQKRLARLHPDIVVLYPTPAGYLNSKPPFAALPDTSPRSHALARAKIFYPRVLADLRAEAKQLAPSALLRWLRRRELRNARSEHSPEWRFTTLPEARLSQYDSDLRRFVGIIRAAGAEPVIATHANVFMNDSSSRGEDMLEAWERFYPRATGAILVAFDSAARIVTQRVAADSATAVVDLADALSHGSTHYFADAVHFTDVGAALVAARVADELSNSGVRLKGGD